MDMLKVEIAQDCAEIKSRLEAEGRFDFSDYRRASSQTRMAMVAAAAAAAGDMSRWAVVGWNGGGCVRENRAYWDDYVSAGRETARGSLFVPTLPSIPACEAAIAIGAHAECSYYRTLPDTREISEIVEDLMASSPRVDGVVVVESDPERAVAVRVPRGGKLPHGFRSLKEVTLMRKEC